MESRVSPLLRPYLSLLILVPDEGQITREKLSQMVREVNATQVEVQEQLSDFVYYYNAENRGIVRL